MKNDLPTGSLGRTLAGGRTAAKVGGKMLGYYVKRPFLSPAGRTRAKEKAAQEGAQTLFQGLSLLKGTALKMAQQLSLEMDLLPEAACRELAKAYHQVPPINRALVRKVVQDGLGRSPEQAFTRFEPDAFAAASLGQVHRAVNADGQDLVVKCFYTLNVVHADPNPGNFIIADDATIGLVDFGCIKRVQPDFIETYRQLVRAAAHHSGDTHFQLMIDIGLIPPGQDAETVEKVREVSDAIGDWFGCLFAQDYFDFKAHPGFIARGYALMRQYHHLRRHMKVNPDFIFLDRTRYGLLRIFEMMGARVRFRNPYEW